MAIMGLKQMAFICTGGTGHGSCPPDMTLTTLLAPVTKSRCVIMGTRKSVDLWIGRANVHYDFGRMQQQN